MSDLNILGRASKRCELARVAYDRRSEDEEWLVEAAEEIKRAITYGLNYMFVACGQEQFQSDRLCIYLNDVPKKYAKADWYYTLRKWQCLLCNPCRENTYVDPGAIRECLDAVRDLLTVLVKMPTRAEVSEILQEYSKHINIDDVYYQLPELPSHSEYALRQAIKEALDTLNKENNE